jgi:hypothetical protein
MIDIKDMPSCTLKQMADEINRLRKDFYALIMSTRTNDQQPTPDIYDAIEPKYVLVTGQSCGIHLPVQKV